MTENNPISPNSVTQLQFPSFASNSGQDVARPVGIKTCFQLLPVEQKKIKLLTDPPGQVICAQFYGGQKTRLSSIGSSFSSHF